MRGSLINPIDNNVMVKVLPLTDILNFVGMMGNP